MGTQNIRYIRERYIPGDEGDELRGEILVCNQDNRCGERISQQMKQGIVIELGLQGSHSGSCSRRRKSMSGHPM